MLPDEPLDVIRKEYEVRLTAVQACISFTPSFWEDRCGGSFEERVDFLLDMLKRTLLNQREKMRVTADKSRQ